MADAARKLMTVEEFLVRHSGRATFEKFWKPLLLAKLGEALLPTQSAERRMLSGAGVSSGLAKISPAKPTPPMPNMATVSPPAG